MLNATQYLHTSCYLINKLKVLLTSGPDGEWAHNAKSSTGSTSKDSGILKDSLPTPMAAHAATSSSVVGNVSSFLSGIRATFRQENVNVVSQQGKSIQHNINSHHGK